MSLVNLNHNQTKQTKTIHARGVKNNKIYKFSCIIAQELSPKGEIRVIGPDLSEYLTRQEK